MQSKDNYVSILYLILTETYFLGSPYTEILKCVLFFKLVSGQDLYNFIWWERKGRPPQAYVVLKKFLLGGDGEWPIGFLPKLVTAMIKASLLESTNTAQGHRFLKSESTVAALF